MSASVTRWSTLRQSTVMDFQLAVMSTSSTASQKSRQDRCQSQTWPEILQISPDIDQESPQIQQKSPESRQDRYQIRGRARNPSDIPWYRSRIASDSSEIPRIPTGSLSIRGVAGNPSEIPRHRSRIAAHPSEMPRIPTKSLEAGSVRSNPTKHSGASSRIDWECRKESWKSPRPPPPLPQKKGIGSG